MRFVTAPGFDNGEEYFQFLKDSFDVLYEEGRRGAPKMMSIGLHCRLVGMPGRYAGLARFLDYIQSKDKVWIARRVDIARHWAQHHPYEAPKLVPSEMDRTQFVGHFGSIFEHSSWRTSKLSFKNWKYSSPLSKPGAVTKRISLAARV